MFKKLPKIRAYTTLEELKELDPDFDAVTHIADKEYKEGVTVARFLCSTEPGKSLWATSSYFLRRLGDENSDIVYCEECMASSEMAILLLAHFAL